MDILSILLRYSQKRKYLTRQITLKEKLKKFFFKKNIILSNKSNPDFLIIGLQKSGSSWLSENVQIKGYIDIINEMHFFDSMIDKNIFFHRFKSHNSKIIKSIAYKSLESKHQNLYEDKSFSDLALKHYQNYIFWSKKKSDIKYIGEKTTEYTFFIDYLNKNFPHTKKIVILRNPKDRIVSRFFHEKRKNRLNDKKISNFFINSYLVRIDLEYENLLKNKRNTYLLTFENLRKNFSKELKNLFKFLNLNLNINEIKEIMKRTELRKLKKKKPNSNFRTGKVGNYYRYIDKEKLTYINKMFFKKHKKMEKLYKLKLDASYYS